MLDQLAKEELKDMPLIDVAYEYLKEKNDSLNYLDIMENVFKIKGYNKEDKKNYMSYLFTQLNIDGRFICVGKGTWGLRDWYSIDQENDSSIYGQISDDFDDIEDVDYIEPEVDSEDLDIKLDETSDEAGNDLLEDLDVPDLDDDDDE